MNKFICPNCKQKITSKWICLGYSNKIYTCKTCNNKLVFDVKGRFIDILSFILAIAVVYILAVWKMNDERITIYNGSILTIITFISYIIIYKIISLLFPCELRKLDDEDK